MDLPKKKKIKIYLIPDKYFSKNVIKLLKLRKLNKFHF